MATKTQMRISRIRKRFLKFDPAMCIVGFCSKCHEDSVIRFDGDDLCEKCALILLIKLETK